MCVGDHRHVPAALATGKIPGTHFKGGWVGRRACMGRFGNFRSN